MRLYLNRFFKRHLPSVAIAAGVLFFAAAALTQTGQSDAASLDQIAQRAVEEAEAGHNAEAISDFQTVLKARPNWREGRWNLGMLEYQTSDFEGATKEFKQIVVIAPQMGAAWAVLGLSEYELHRYEESLKALEKAHALGVKEDEEIARVADYHLALARTRAGECDAARELLLAEFAAGQPNSQIKIALGLAGLKAPLIPAELDPSREALVAAVGEALLDREHGSEKLAQIAKEHPEIPSLRQDSKPESKNDAAVMRRLFALDATSARDSSWLQAQKDYFSGRDVEAAQDLKAWVASHPDDGTAWAMLGLCEYRQKDYANALIHLDRGATLGMKATEDEIREGRYTYSLLLIHAGKFEQATEVLFTMSDQKNELSSEVEFALGLALLRRAEFPESVSVSEAEFVHSAGKIAAMFGASKYDEAFPLFDALIAAHPRDPWLHYSYGTALIALSEFDKAAVQMKLEAEISLQSELPLLRLASIALRSKNPAAATDWARKALALRSDSAEGHYLLGRALLESGDAESAIHELEAAVKLSPASPEIHFNLAKAYTRAKRLADAERERKLFSDLNENAKKPQ
jgi:tetratricopeptide (TPR) repeat protein